MDETLVNYGRRLGVERILQQARAKLKRDWFAGFADELNFAIGPR